MGLGFEDNFVPEEFLSTIGNYVFAPLAVLPCVWPIAFLLEVHFLTGTHCKVGPNTERPQPICLQP
jgi:hypothetical protein